MRVLQVLLSPRIGGAESAASSLASAWAESGIVSEIVYLDSRGTRPSSRLGYLSKQIRRFRPDIVLSHSAIPNLYSRIAKGLMATPVVCVLHSATRDLDDSKLLLLERILRSRAAAIIAVSSTQVSEYQAHFPRQALDLIPNGISHEYTPAPTIPNDVRVVTVGRVVDQKDPRTWAAITQLSAKVDHHILFEWVGPVDLDPGYSSLVSRYSDPSAPQRFVGPTDRVIDALRRSRLLLHTAHREAHSVALLEAAATGLPIVCTKEVGRQLPPWIVRQEFEEGNAEDGHAALRRVIDDLEDFESRARQQAWRVLREFGIRGSSERYLDVFHRVLRGSS